jgi:hypothetical protein
MTTNVSIFYRKEARVWAVVWTNYAAAESGGTVA